MTTTKTKRPPKAAVVKRDVNLPAQDVLDLMGADAGAGMEEMTAADYAIPFIHLVQALSPQKAKRDPKYIQGCEEGDYFNSVTEDLYKGEEGFNFVPVMFRKVYNEWVPRKLGGGFAGSHPTALDAAQNADPENEITDTAMIFGLIQGPDGTWAQGVLSLTSTKLKVARKWNSIARMRKIPDGKGGHFTPPYFGVVYHVTSVTQENQHGAFFNMKVEAGILTLERDDGVEVYTAAKDFLTLLKADRVGADFNRAVDVDSVDEEDIDSPF